MLSERETAFERLIASVQSCDRCEVMEGCTRVLSWANGPPQASVMFVGEAPGRLGADRTAVPFHGDKSGDNFEALLALAGLSRREVFVTNAVLCNPKDEAGNNAPPSREVIRNCAENLAQQIATVQPRIVVTLGAAALDSTRLIEEHGLTLSGAVRTSNSWFGRRLIPLYHPGARAMIHRNFALQTADYYFVGEQVRRLSRAPRRATSQAKAESPGWDLVRYVIASLGECSLFRLHKTMYLVDLDRLGQSGGTATGFFYVRQKEGPYCVELGSRWFKSYEDQIKFGFREGKPWLAWKEGGLFSGPPGIDADLRQAADRVLEAVSTLSDAELKTKSYLTNPMKASLRAERAGSTQLNRPLL